LGPVHKTLIPLPLAAVLLAGAGGCTIEDPELPSYESVWLIPLGDVDYTMEELIEDEDGFLVGDDKSLSFHVAGQLDAVEVGPHLTFDVDGASTDAAIGAIDLGPSGPVAFAFRLGDVYPPAAALDGFTTPVPSFTFDLASPPEDLPGFTSASIESGGVDVDLVNGLPVPVGGPTDPERLHLDLVDPGTGTTLTSLVIDTPIAAGESDSRFLDLAGLDLPDSVAVRLRGGSPGSAGNPVTVDADAQIAISVQTTTLEVRAVQGEIGFQQFTNTITTPLPDVQLVGASIASGQLDVDLANDLPVPAAVHVAVASVFDATDQPLGLDVPVGAGSAVTAHVDLAGCRADFGAQPVDHLDVDLTITTPGSSGQSVWFHDTDTVHAAVQPFTIEFAEVSGILDPQTIDIPQAAADIALPNKLEDVELLAAELVVELQSSLGLPATVALHLEGFDEDGVMVPLDLTLDLPASRPGVMQTHRVVLNETNSGLIPFMNNLPTRVTAEGTADVGDGTSIGVVSATSAVSAHYEITAPLVVKVLPHTVEVDPTVVELDDDLRDELDKRLVSATLEATISNTLPVDATVFLSFDPQSDRLYTAPQVRLGPIEVPRSTTARTGGQLGEAQVTSEIPVEQDMIPVLLGPDLTFGVSIDVPGSDGRYVTIRADDLMRVQGFVRARVRMGDL
jgi:hypothetical protein